MSSDISPRQIGWGLIIALFVSFGEMSPGWAQAFTPTGNMTVARVGHQATLLIDGRVLASGGYDDAGNGIAQAEIFDPATRSWAATGSNIVARLEHATVLLQDGRVLAVGGASSSSSCSSKTAEIYDPATGKWSLTANLSVAIGSGLIAVRLRDGRVLVSGGADRCGTVSKMAMLFDPSKNAWFPTGEMTVHRAFHSAVVLTDGRVLVAGGLTIGNGLLASAEVYNPATEGWTAVGSMAVPRATSCGGYSQPFLSILHSGAALAAGATSGNCSSLSGPIDTELFYPNTMSWSATGKTTVPRAMTTLTSLSGVAVLVAGGIGPSGQVQSSVELFDALTGTWDLIGSLNIPRTSHTTTRLPNGSVLIAGGNDGVHATAAAEIYIRELVYRSGPFCAQRAGTASGVATNSKGHVFVSYSSGSQEARVLESVPSDFPLPDCWRRIREFRERLDSAHVVRVDKNDNVWVVDAATDVIVKFDPEGRVLLRFGGRPSSTDGLEDTSASNASPQVQRYLNGPTDVTWDPAGNIFVSDSGNSRVVKYDTEGRFLKAVGSSGSVPGQMKMPHSIAADAKGNIYVADGGNARIQVFDSDLTLRTIYNAVGAPWAICITSEPHQYLYSSSNPYHNDTVPVGVSIPGEVYKLELDGTIVGKIGPADNPLGNFRALDVMDCRHENDLIGTELTDGISTIRVRP